MAQEKLLDIAVGQGLETGLYPSADPTSGAVWSGGQNIWFRDLTAEQVPGRQRFLHTVGATADSLTQAFNEPNKSLYYDYAGTVYRLNGTGNPTVFGTPEVIGEATPDSEPWLEPWGDWLIITDGIEQPNLWQGAVGTAPIPIGVGQFKTARIIKKLAQFAIAYNLDTGNNAFAWSRLSDPTEWTPPQPPDFASEAGGLTIRDLDSGIVAVADLAGAHGVYSQNTLLVVQYVGFQNGWFGTPNQAISGIGAVSRRSVVSVGQFNFGITRTGIFATDGTNVSWLDRPAVDKWLQENVDWTRAGEIKGFWNGKLQNVVWIIPLVPSSPYYDPAFRKIALALDPKIRTSNAQAKKTFSFLDTQINLGMEQEVFDYPISVLKDGLYYETVPGTLIGNFHLESQLFDGGDTSIYKLWDFMILKGTFDFDDPTLQIRFGYTDKPTLDSVKWGDWQALTIYTPPIIGPFESVFFAFAIRGSSTFKLTAVTVYGEKGGLVN